MTLRLIQSTDPDALVKHLADAIRQEAGLTSSVFVQHDIGVSNRGMRTWLSQRLAMQNTICSQVHFPFPSELIFTALADDDAQIDGDPWREDALPWALLTALPTVLSESDLALDPLRNYLADILGVAVDDVVTTLEGQPISRALWALVCQLASLFDDYLAFRPNWAASWSLGHDIVARMLPDDAPQAQLNHHFGWQQPLWHAVCAHLGPSVRLELTADRRRTASNHPIRLFMPAELPPLLQRGLRQLARSRPVDVYLLSYGSNIWSEVRAHYPPSDVVPIISRNRLEAEALGAVHPLRASCGRGELDTALVSNWLADESIWLSGSTQRTADSLLHQLQRRVAGEAQPSGELNLRSDDESIQFHSCHGPRRQVEVLREALLHLLDRYDGEGSQYPLQPRHILVLVSDLAQFAPLIESVFAEGKSQPNVSGDWGDVGAPRMEVELVGRSFRRTNPVAETLLTVLDFASVDERMTASGVLDFLNLGPVMSRFRLSVDDLGQLREWFDTVQIRWGIDGAHRQSIRSPGEIETDDGLRSMAFPAETANSLLEGLERLLLGVVLADDGAIFDSESGGHLIPFDDMEGSARALVGRLADVVTTLVDVVERLRTPRPVKAWIDTLLGRGRDGEGGALARLVSTPGRMGFLSRHVREALQEFERSAADGLGGSVGPDLDTRTLRAALAQRFELRDGYDPNSSGAVTFASLNTHTRLPYDVIALLGFDDEIFPRTPNRQQFDGVALTRQVGDIDGADTDRARFLEAVMAAQRHLLVFYSGRHVRTNHERAPAVVIGELMDAIDDFVAPVEPSPDVSILPSRWLTRHHPLQAFSPSNYRDCSAATPRFAGHAGPPWSYTKPIWLYEFESDDNSVPWDFSAGLHDAPELQPLEQPLEMTIELDELVRFFKNPAAFFMRRRLNMYLKKDPDALAEREPVWLDGLAKYGIKDNVLRGVWQQGAMQAIDPDIEARLRAEGVLPWGPAGRRAVESSAEAIRVLFGERGLDCFDDPIPIGQARDATTRGFKLELLVPNPQGEMPRKVNLTGALGPALGDVLLKVFPGNLAAKRRIEVWLSGLCWAAMHPDIDTAVWSVYTKVKGGAPITDPEGYLFRADRLAEFEAVMAGARPVTTAAEWARTRLTEIVGLYIEGHHAPLPYFPDASCAFGWGMKTLWMNHDVLGHSALDEPVLKLYDLALSNVQKSFRGPVYKGAFDFQIPEIKRLFETFQIVSAGPKRRIFHPDFFRVSHTFWDGAFQQFASKRSSGEKNIGCRFTFQNLKAWGIKTMAKSSGMTHG
ncbi:MAG: exodeoxyribonuclease V subunit gamma [Myxococcota bacterium]|nr:exodeoxyribonuclease V subunit gamma [Myxococcota bacterium]